MKDTLILAIESSCDEITFDRIVLPFLTTEDRKSVV